MTAYMLKVNITKDVNHVQEGITLGLKDDREKNSELLDGRLALYTGSSVITRLPPILTVQMMRFFYKADVNQKAKILRKVCGHSMGPSQVWLWLWHTSASGMLHPP